MRVGFDCSPLAEAQNGYSTTGSGQAVGLARVVEQVIAALERRAQIEAIPLTPKAPSSLLSWRMRGLPAAVKEHNLFGIHSFTSAFPFRGPGRRVQTIHELPWLHGARENAGFKHRSWARFGPLLADRVVTATEFVASDLRSHSPFARNKIDVCPWGVSADFADEPPPGTIDEALLGHYRLPEDPLVLCLGAVRKKKNLAGVLRAVAEVKQRGGPRLHVVVTGYETQDLRRDLGLAAKLGLSANISTLDTIEPEHLPGMLRLASVVPVLSHSEGFGLVTLEALACGTPVVVPDNSAQAEVAGSFGIVVDVRDDCAVADGLIRAVNDRETLRYTLAARAEQFSWNHTAQRIEQVWQALDK